MVAASAWRLFNDIRDGKDIDISIRLHLSHQTVRRAVVQDSFEWRGHHKTAHHDDQPFVLQGVCLPLDVREQDIIRIAQSCDIVSPPFPRNSFLYF